jgi:hypothetical protein
MIKRYGRHMLAIALVTASTVMTPFDRGHVTAQANNCTCFNSVESYEWTIPDYYVEKETRWTHGYADWRCDTFCWNAARDIGRELCDPYLYGGVGYVYGGGTWRGTGGSGTTGIFENCDAIAP